MTVLAVDIDGTTFAAAATSPGGEIPSRAEVAPPGFGSAGDARCTALGERWRGSPRRPLERDAGLVPGRVGVPIPLHDP